MTGRVDQDRRPATGDRRPRTSPVLHAILDVDAARAAGWAASDLAQAFLDGGAPLLQIRAKRLAAGPCLLLCDLIVQLARPYGAAVIVNDRVDLARMAGAAGVHLGQEDVAPAYARALLGDEAMVGYSTHTAAQIEAALPQPVDYIAVGPVFETQTKDTGYEAVGLELVATAARVTAGRRPVVAIGGITIENAPAVMAAGASAVAVIGDLLVGRTPEARVAAYLRAIGKV